MSIFSQNFKIVNAFPSLSADHATANITDVVSLKLYRRATFIVNTGISANNDSTFAVVAGQTVGGTVDQTVPFKYRKCVSGDTFGALTDVAAGSSIALTASTADQMLVIEVNAQDVETAHPGYDCIALKYTRGSNHAAISMAITAIMSGPRYADDLQPSAIID